MKKTSKLRKKWRCIHKKKLRDELLSICMVILGVILFICGKNKIAPGMENPIEVMVTIVVSVGYFVGPTLVLLGIASFFNVRNKKYFRKKRHR